MAHKIAVVTGSNKGIGFGIVRGLCKRFDGVVYLTSRDENRGKAAVTELQKEGLNPKFHQLDITKKESVEKFRDYIKNNYGGIDILVNNAAIAFKGDAPEPASVQAEQTLFVNYFSLVSSCEILLPIMKFGGRVINLSSYYGLLKHIPSKTLREKLQDPNLTISQLSEMMQQYIDAARKGVQVAEWGNSSYAVSKVAVVALSKIQQRMLNDRDIKLNAVEPGYVVTDMSSNKGFLTIDEGAQATVFLALDADDSVRGEYVQHDKKIGNWAADKVFDIMVWGAFKYYVTKFLTIFNPSSPPSNAP